MGSKTIAMYYNIGSWIYLEVQNDNHDLVFSAHVDLLFATIEIDSQNNLVISSKEGYNEGEVFCMLPIEPDSTVRLLKNWKEKTQVSICLSLAKNQKTQIYRVLDSQVDTLIKILPLIDKDDDMIKTCGVFKYEIVEVTN
jgi:hypothetical protein